MPVICPSNLIFIDRGGLMSTSFSCTLLPSSARAARKFRELFLEDAPLLPSAEADLNYTHEVSDFVKFLTTCMKD